MLLLKIEQTNGVYAFSLGLNGTTEGVPKDVELTVFNYLTSQFRQVFSLD